MKPNSALVGRPEGLLMPLELAHLPYRRGRTYEDYLGMRGWIEIQNIPIESATNNFSLMNNYGADRHLARI